MTLFQHARYQRLQQRHRLCMERYERAQKRHGGQGKAFAALKHVTHMMLELELAMAREEKRAA